VYGWPGNVRELQNVIERAVILSDADTFSVDETWLKGEPPQVARVALNGALLRQEKEMIEAALAESYGRISGPTGAAANLGPRAPDTDTRLKNQALGNQQISAQNPTG
jgi:formate hydrogenlyase transcriptional activator